MLLNPVSSVYSPFGLQGISGGASLYFPAGNQNLSALFGGSSVVELSGLGQLLSSVSSFENSMSNLHPGLTTSGIGQNFGTDFGSLAAESQSFVDAFNSLSNNLSRLQASSGALSGDVLATRFANALNTEATATLKNGTSTLISLAKIGIKFQPPSNQNMRGTLSIDLKTLQSAFESDPASTFSLLGQVAQNFSSLAAEFSHQAGTLSATLSQFAQFNFGNFSGQSMLNDYSPASFLQTNTIFNGSSSLFSAGLDTGPISLVDLINLQSSGSTNTNFGAALGLQLNAFNQYNLVSSLLGSTMQTNL